MRIVVGAAKGGVGKTTTSLYLATGLAQREPTILIDGDPQRSATAWWRRAEQRGQSWPLRLSLAGWPTRGALRMPSLDEAAHVVVDTGPGAGTERFREAMGSADVVIIPSGAKDADIAQVGDTVADVEKVDRVLTYAVLLTQVRLRTRNLTLAREALDSDGVPVWDVAIPYREDMVSDFGTVPDIDRRHGLVYRDLLAEITRTQEA